MRRSDTFRAHACTRKGYLTCHEGCYGTDSVWKTMSEKIPVGRCRACQKGRAMPAEKYTPPSLGR